MQLPKKQIAEILISAATHGRTAAAYFATAVLLSIAAGLARHHVDWYTVGTAACTAGAMICRQYVPASWLTGVSKN